MARKKTSPVLTPANPQTQSKLLADLPPELRTNIWEFVEYVEPDSNGTIALRPAKKRRDSDDDRPKTVLTLLQTCSLVNREASGIFYNMNHLAVTADHDYSLPRGHLFLDPFQPSARLDAINCITFNIVTNHGFEFLIKTCKEISQLIQHVQTLTFEFPYWGRNACGAQRIVLNQEERDKWFLKKAVAKLPGSLKEFKVVFACSIFDRPLPKVKQIVEDVFFSKLPKVEKKVLLLRVGSDVKEDPSGVW